jgi:hypothetical protein
MKSLMRWEAALPTNLGPQGRWRLECIWPTVLFVRHGKTRRYGRI